MKIKNLHIALLLAFFLTGLVSQAQKPGDLLRGIGNRIPSGGGGGAGSGGGSDSLVARNMYEDSLTVSIHYLDSSRAYRMDSSINDFTRRYPVPATYINLGNTGTAARSLLFSPEIRTGWDPGFHALDIYKWKMESVRFYNTTRPYTELGYMLGSRSEQMIEISHTQNIKPYWNFSLAYRLINAPGIFRNQKTNHNNYLLTSWYQSRNKRYNNYFVVLGNRLQTGESGGMQNPRDLDTVAFAKDRFLIPTQIGGSPVYGRDFFNTSLTTGNRYREFNILMRQQYDLGRKDSIVTDSTVIPLFYPRLRFEHTFNYGRYSYNFTDIANSGDVDNVPDSQYYHDNYDLTFNPGRSLLFRDQWREVSNDFSIYQFPDAKNQQQFIKLGASLQILQGQFTRDSQQLESTSLFNSMAHGEYRNRSKNQKWDILAFGKFFLSGYSIGNYHAYGSIQRQVAGLGSLKLGFENANRSPSFQFDERSGFYLDAPKDFSNENTAHAFASLFLKKQGLMLTGDYYLISNYLYLNGYNDLQQESSLFNVLRVNASKVFRLGRRWNWHAELYVQQKAGDAQVNLPAVFTRNRVMYEGSLGFPSLNIAFGAEMRYHTPYKADNYSPVLGQFFYQNTTTIRNLPDVHAFMHFRIRSFRGYLRAENLNTARFLGGFQFNNNNLSAPNYATPGLVIRFGILWGFVN